MPCHAVSYQLLTIIISTILQTNTVTNHFLHPSLKHCISAHFHISNPSLPSTIVILWHKIPNRRQIITQISLDILPSTNIPTSNMHSAPAYHTLVMAIISKPPPDTNKAPRYCLWYSAYRAIDDSRSILKHELYVRLYINQNHYISFVLWVYVSPFQINV